MAAVFYSAHHLNVSAQNQFARRDHMCIPTISRLESKAVVSLIVLGLLTLGLAGPAQAQIPVIDVASLMQLLQQFLTLEQQVATAKSQLTQAQSEYSALTGNRGMQNLLSGTSRNYMPTNWTQVSQVMNGSSGSYPGLAANVAGLVTSNAVLTPAQMAALSPAEQARLVAARQDSALLQAASRTALSNSSDRFAELQQLIGAIGTAQDPKASLDLNARIAAEEGMLENEHTKLEMLYRVAQSQEWARRQQVREQAIADQGSLRTLPALGL
jgi:type IV secretion system protein VirB5